MSCFIRLSDNECFYPRELLLKSRHEVVRSVLKQHDKTEGEKHEQSNPKETAQQRHA